MGLRPLKIMFTLNSAGSTLDVYKRQILTSKVDPRAVRVNYQTFGLFFLWFSHHHA